MKIKNTDYIYNATAFNNRLQLLYLTYKQLSTTTPFNDRTCRRNNARTKYPTQQPVLVTHDRTNPKL
jgi:hypothetical protein